MNSKPVAASDRSSKALVAKGRDEPGRFQFALGDVLDVVAQRLFYFVGETRDEAQALDGIPLTRLIEPHDFERVDRKAPRGGVQGTAIGTEGPTGERAEPVFDRLELASAVNADLNSGR